MVNNIDVNKRRITKNIIFLYAKVIINMVLGLFTTRIILKVLGASDYGIYGIVAGTVAMLASLNFAMVQTTQRFMSYAKGSDDKELLRKYFNVSIIIHVVLGVFVLFLMELFYFPMFDGILNIPENRLSAAKIIYHFIVISTVFAIFTVPYDATINAHEDLVYYSVVGVLESFLKFAAAVAISYVSVDKLVLYGVFLAIISILMMIIMRVYCYKHYSECIFSPRRFADKTTMITMGKFAGWNFLGSLSAIAGNYGTTLLINHFFGVIVNAAKSIADQLCSMVGVFSDNMMKAFNPTIVKQEGGGNRRGMIDLSLISCRMSYLMYSLLAVPFCLEMPFLLHLWLKDVPQWAILFCQLQILRTLLEQISIPIRMSLMARGKIKYMSIASFVWSCLTFIVLFVMYKNGELPYWHFVISIIFMVILDTACKLYLCKRYCDLSLIDFLLNVCGRSLLCTLIQIMPGIVILYYCQQSISRLIYIILVCSTSLVLISYIVGLKFSERNYLLSVLKNKLIRR